jgi:hypothetical protein
MGVLSNTRKDHLVVLRCEANRMKAINRLLLISMFGARGSYSINRDRLNADYHGGARTDSALGCQRATVGRGDPMGDGET